MEKHKWKSGDECKTHCGFPCRIIGYRSDGTLVWETRGGSQWMIQSGAGGRGGLDPRPPTLRVETRINLGIDGNSVWIGGIHNIECEFEEDGVLVGVKLIDEETQG